MGRVKEKPVAGVSMIDGLGARLCDSREMYIELHGS